MSLSRERIFYLLDAHTSGISTPQEEQELMEWLYDDQEDANFKAYIRNQWDSLQNDPMHSTTDWNRMFDEIIQKNRVIPITSETKNNKKHWWKFAAAAAVILAIVYGGSFLFSTGEPVTTLTENIPVQTEVDVTPPSANKATLTLANGKVLVLENIGFGSLASEGIANASIPGSAELAYTANRATEVEYHTLTVPRGSPPMQLHLADGSAVWLNAASSIRFPNIFAGSERTVTVTGETYFEVAHQSGKPFIVNGLNMEVRVLGTKFNVNAYENEDAIRVTLMEGSVKVLIGENESYLKPGQQAKMNKAGITVLDNVNTPEVMAWKNGLFVFNRTDIQTIMRQIERWYDVDVVFEEQVEQHISGSIQRMVNVSKLLNMLEKTGGVRFTIKGRKVIIKKYN